MSVRIRKPANAGEVEENPVATNGDDSTAAAPAPAVVGKEPPPESSSDIRRRSYVIMSFWLIVLLLGLPIWWKTTTIYRAYLPLDEMLEWADGRACRPVFPLRISIDATSLQDSEAQHLLRLTQHALDDLNDFSGHHLRLELSPPREPTTASIAKEDDVALTIRLRPGEATEASLDPYSPILDITYPPSSVPSAASSSSSLAGFVATQLRSTFAEEQAIISYLLSTSTASSSADQRPQALSPEVAEALTKRSTRSLRNAPTYHLTFSLFTSGAAPSSWDIKAAIEEHMRPVLDVLGPIHNFTIDTQVQLYAQPGVQSQLLSKEDLSSFINAAEWPLSPSIGGAPTVNFVVFVGNQTIGTGQSAGGLEEEIRAAAAAAGETSQSWLIPQWGSVYLLPVAALAQAHNGNGNGAAAAHIPLAALKEPMLTFTSHLLALLGTPQSGSLPLQLSTLSRVRSADLVLRASSTLGSLARLSLALPSISIPGSVADGVASTIRHLRLACDSLGGADGLAHARVAEAEAERAFFEKSMVGQLYFPDEHKVAVYLPLLGPVGVPLVMGLLNEIKAWRRRRKEAATAAAAKAKANAAPTEVKKDQ